MIKTTDLVGGGVGDFKKPNFTKKPFVFGLCIRFYSFVCGTHRYDNAVSVYG